MKDRRYSALWLLVLPSLLFAQVNFVEIGAPAGLDRATESYGASWGDFDGDGFVDLFVSNHRGKNSLYRNNQDRTFSDIADTIAVFNNRSGADTHGGAWSDADNDGDLDLLISTGVRNNHQFLINTNGNLVERTGEWMIEYPEVGGRLPIWYDYNNDSLMDVILIQYGGIAALYTNRGDHFTSDRSTVRLLCLRAHYGHLLSIDDDETLDLICAGEPNYPQKIYDMAPVPWRNITPDLPPVANVADSIAGDFNNDLRSDLFLLSGLQTRVSSATRHGTQVEAQLTGGNKGFNFESDGDLSVDLAWNRLDRNDALSFVYIGANGTNPTTLPFTLDSGDPANAGFPIPPGADRLPYILIGFDDSTQRWRFVVRTEGTWSDAHFLIDAPAGVTDLQATGLWGTDRPSPSTLLRKTAGGWANVSTTSGVNVPVLCASVTSGDYDNDGDLDLYLACGNGSSNLPNAFFWNDGSGQFTYDASGAGARGVTGGYLADAAGSAETAITADIDNDGFLDIFVTNGINLNPKFAGGPGQLFRNQRNGNSWVMLDLIGVQAKDAIGARVIATAAGNQQLRRKDGGYHRWAQEHGRVHFGLGAARSVDLTIEWPTGGIDTYRNVAVNEIYQAEEGQPLQPIDDRGPPECGQPEFDPGAVQAAYVWRPCGGGSWHIDVAAGGQFGTFSGGVSSTSALTGLQGLDIEPNDQIDTNIDPAEIEFTLTVGRTGVDTLLFQTTAGANSCFELQAPASARVFFGKNRTPVPNRFDLNTLDACAPPTSNPTLTIDAGSASEADGSIEFNVTLSRPSTEVVSAIVGTTNGSALAGSDYSAPATHLSIPAGTLTTVISVPLHDDNQQEPDEDFRVTLSSPTNAILATATATGTIIDDDGPPGTCGSPTVDLASDRSIFVYEDCVTGQYSVRFTAGDRDASYAGTITSSTGFSQVTPFSIEPSDTLQQAGNQVAFQLQQRPGRWDGFELQVPTGGGLCIALTDAPSDEVRIGPTQIVAAAPVNLVDLTPCHTPSNEIACGMPTVDYAVDRAPILYRSCATDEWSLLLSPGGTFTPYAGTIDSSLGFDTLTPISFEPNDSLNLGPARASFQNRVGNSHYDAINFQLPAGTAACIDFSVAPGATVIAGPSRRLIPTPFNPLTGAPC